MLHDMRAPKSEPMICPYVCASGRAPTRLPILKSKEISPAWLAPACAIAADKRLIVIPFGSERDISVANTNCETMQ